ncbi:OmpA family protein [Pseudomonas cichorii]|uniref:OmpA family protein n=2 Tax=Pseudomonas lijiangensis TaxID=2995658 RepID=A0ABX8I078_9PSED|nr:OmpA family protein [Pseudomonas lijiangensis]MBX8505932.1 OmpA family protein [Pseudomonas lijiangensis]MBX8534183.1 OmpA family protein [Pseudomonas cichorii]MBX8602057.1 OmpA family protein [Pseudomonas cichorii]QWU85778.1 OmpA family protein [Pseudomonas lijiangensis]
MQARQSQRGLKRKSAAAAAASATPVGEAENDSWMMTYLDMMTLLLVVTMAMLAMAGKGHSHTQKTDGDLSPLMSAKNLTQVQQPDQPGKLLLVPKTEIPAEPEPVVEPVATSAPTEVITETAAIEPPPPAAPAPSVDDLLKELPLDKLGDDIEVVTNESTISFRINSEILFPSGQSDLNLGGLKVLQHLIPVLESVSHKVIVTGHTDTQDIRSSRFPSNWELSSARAGSVVRYLQSNGIKGNRLAAVGYADTQPLGDNHTARGRASNRRVELVLER